MNSQSEEVLADRRKWSVEQADCIEFLKSLPARCCSLALGSPPYEDARTYGIDFSLKGEDWVAWMREVVLASLCAADLVAFVIQGKTTDFRWSAVPMLLGADLHRMGVHLRNPVIFHRVGIPGSGGPDWWRSDYEWIICCTHGGELPWSDNTACGKPPKWAPGGEMSYRISDGTRRNQWGASPNGAKARQPNGKRQDGKRPSHKVTSKAETRQATPRKPDGSRETQEYEPPTLANPGTVCEQLYTAEEVTELLGLVSDVKRCNVGGGQMGSPLAHHNEAPYPEELVELLVRSFCPPGGIVVDPFAGSGTTLAVALRWGRRALGCDIRESQVKLATKRLQGETPMFTAMV